MKYGQTYELTGRVTFDRTTLVLENVKVNVENLDELIKCQNHQGLEWTKCDSCIGLQWLHVTILEESKHLVNATIEALKNDTLENYLKDFLWDELEGVISWLFDSLIVNGMLNKNGVFTDYHIYDDVIGDSFKLIEIPMMEKCNDCKQMVEQAPFGQCDPCFDKALSNDGSVVYTVNSEVQ